MIKREISCRIANSILVYVRKRNDGSLGRLLEGVPVDEAYLADVNNWISHDLLQMLYGRMIEVLGDPNAVYNMTMSSGKAQALGFLDRLARLLGSPRIIYINTPKYNRFFKTCGDIFVRESGPDWVILEDRYHPGTTKTRHDCDYTRGVLSGIPTLFGMPPAHVEELSCEIEEQAYGRRIWPDAPVHGAKGCVYRIHYRTGKKLPFWQRWFRQSKTYDRAIEDLLEANRTIQQKYDQVFQLATELDSANRQLLESKRQLEANKRELEVSESKYRLLADYASDIIWTFDIETLRFDYVSPSVLKMRGYSVEEASGSGLKDTLTPRAIEIVLKALEEELARDGLPGIDPNRDRIVEVEGMRRDGSHMWFEANMTFIRDENGRAVGVTGASRDVTERKLAQIALHAEKERLAVTLHSIADGVITTDKEGAVTFINPVAVKLTGWVEQQALGRPLSDIFNPVDMQTRQHLGDPMATILEGPDGHHLSQDALLIARDGSEATIAQSGSPLLDDENRVIGVVVVFRDITEQRKMIKEFQKVEKLESLGMLAGGIAHDFNNFLAGIIGSLSLAKLDVRPAERVYNRLQEMEKAALRAKHLTQQLLTFAKGGDPVRQATELTGIIREAARFATRGANVLCEFDFRASALFVNADEGQIVQVVHNLIINAIQAMPDGGTITVSCDAVTLTEDNALSLISGAYACITIQDQGGGIQAHHLKNIFDPYFTTKQKGSGLGLAVAYAVIDKHHGRITVDSKVGCGTTFKIYLPSVAPPQPAQSLKEQPLQQGSGRVLIMDDEPFIRDLVGEMLTALGYEVTTTKDGEEAIACYGEAMGNGSRYDVVILDLTVPGGMGGKETVKRLLALDPDVKAIVSSGYSTDPVLADHRTYGFKIAIQKPYRIEELGEAMYTVLGGA